MNVASNEQLVALMIESVKRTENDPQWFFNNILHFPCLPWQLDAINAVFDVRRKLRGEQTVINHRGLPRITIRSCHGTGKTQFLAMLMHIWNFTTHGKIACTAPKEAQLLHRLIPRYRTAMRNAESSYKEHIEVLGREIRCYQDPDWGAIMETSTDPDNLAGYHDPSQLFLIDEASARRLDSMYPVIEGALTTPGSVEVEIGNPVRVEGEFYNHHCKEGTKELYFKFHIKSEDARELISEEWQQTMKLKYGEHSPIYKIRVLGEFASVEDDILIPPEYIEEALDVEREPDGSASHIRVSIDVADGGEDATTITIARHYATFMQVIKQKSFWFDTGKAPIAAALAGARLFEEFGGEKDSEDDFVVDGLGVGAGTVGKLLELGFNVKNYKGGEQSSDPSLWRCKRVECYLSLYNAFKNSEIYIAPNAIEDEEEFRSHLLSIKRNSNSEKYDDIMPKRTIQKSPDRADSLVMQYFDRLTTPTDNLEHPMHIIQGTMGVYDAGLS